MLTIQEISDATHSMFHFLPGEVRVMNIVVESYQDKDALGIAEKIVSGFEGHNKSPNIESGANHLLCIEGTPFFDRLSFLAQKLDIRTFTYLPEGDDPQEYAESARAVQEDVIRHMIEENGVLVAFPKSRCPKMIRPMNVIETLTYRSWGAVAMAIKLGIPVYIYVPAIQDETQFLGPLQSRGRILDTGEWGSWILATTQPEDVDGEVRELMDKLDVAGNDLWVEGVKSRPNFWKQN